MLSKASAWHSEAKANELCKPYIRGEICHQNVHHQPTKDDTKQMIKRADKSPRRLRLHLTTLRKVTYGIMGEGKAREELQKFLCWGSVVSSSEVKLVY